MSGAPPRGGHLGETQLSSLILESLTKVDVPWAGSSGGEAAALNHLRTNFITGATYTDTAVHYNLGRQTASFPRQTADAPAENAPGGAAPAGVKQGDPPTRRHQVDRDTIGDGYGEEDTACGGHPAVDALDLDPAGAGIQAHDLDAMHLIAESDSRKSAQGTSEGEPAAHYVTDRRLAPEAEIEASARIAAAASDAGDDSVSFFPMRNFEAWNLSGDDLFPDLDVTDFCAAPLPRWPAVQPATRPPFRSPHPEPEGARRSARIHARSVPRYEWCWVLRRRERPGAWPSRRGCRAIRRCRP